MIGTDTLGAHGGGEMCGTDGDMPFTPTNPFVGEIEDFVEAVLDNRPPDVDGMEGRRNVELLLAMSG
jgi:predicted dehydrogenase